MKICSDLEQSTKLAEFLPIDSADMYYDVNDDGIQSKPEIIVGGIGKRDIPAWSLSKLMDILPIQFDWELKTYKFKMQTDCYSSGEKYYDLGYQGAYCWLEYEDDTELVDACYKLIIKLHERELL